MINNFIKNTLRPMLKVSEMVLYLKEKNIKFEEYLENEAEKYLKENNNYFNITSYKNNFFKYRSEERRVGKECM